MDEGKLTKPEAKTMGRMGGAYGQVIGADAVRQIAMAGMRSPKPRLVKAGGTEPMLALETAQAELAGRLMQHAVKASEVRLELVARLRERIQAGTYRIDASEVAGSMMRSMLA